MALVMTMEDIAKKIEKMRASFGWEKSDTTLILAKSVFVEAGELLEAASKNPGEKQEILDEVADVLMYAISLCTDAGEDYRQVIEQKIAKVYVKYGAE
jgi:NTP pyrophosphatase (non-canonical NTP hydrolase)